MPLKTTTSLVALILGAATAHATYYFDTNGATAGFGTWTNDNPATELWDLNTTAKWTTSAAGTDATQTWQALTGLNGSTNFTVDQDVTLDASGNARIGLGDDTAGADFIIDMGAFDLTRTGATGTVRIVQGVSPDNNGILRFGGGDVNVTAGALVPHGVNTSGSFTKTGAGSLDLSLSSADGAGISSVTISDGTLKVGAATSINANTSILNNSVFQLANDVIIAKLEGTGEISMAGGGTSEFSLTIEAVENHTFGGATNIGGSRILNLVKTGSADFTLTSAGLDYVGTTTVEEGTLFMNGTLVDTGAVTVQSGGTYGGSGSITTADANFTVENGGQLSPGNSPGTLTVALGTGTFDLTGIGANALIFEVGDTLTDSVVLSTGFLNIGTLDFSEFLFSDAGDLSDGTILTLFDTNETIVGSIGTASGTFGAFNGTLGFGDGGQDLIMTVSAAVPEPSTYALLFGAAMLSLVAIRRKRA